MGTVSGVTTPADVSAKIRVAQSEQGTVRRISPTDEGEGDRRVPIAVFASGNGSNLAALLTAECAAGWPAKIALVVSDNPGCLAVQRAGDAGRDVFARSPKEYSDKASFEQAVLTELEKHGVKWIFLAGYMRLIGATLLDVYRQRIVNIHPSLLPAFPGRHAVQDALRAGVSETGVTIHFVDDGIDTGQIIAQRRVPVEDGMTEEQLLDRIHDVEHELYAEVVERVVG